MKALAGSRVLVTGATGFVGSALVARLLRDGARPRLLVRSGLAADAPSLRGAEIVRGDLASLASLEEAVDGCETVFHCAFAPSPDLETCREANVRGGRNLMAAVERAGVRRVVHASSAAVHGENLPPVLDEAVAYATGGPVYTRVKIELEREILACSGEGRPEVVILRPTLIYGPDSLTWTTQPLQRLRHEEIFLISGGRGLANLVFIADVVQALLRAAVAGGAAGEAFLISGPEPSTWRELLGAYAELLGKPAPASLSLRAARRVSRADALRYRLLRRPPRILPLDLRMQTATHRVSIDKARRELGYAPEYDLERGIAEIRTWAREQRYPGFDRAAPRQSIAASR